MPTIPEDAQNKERLRGMTTGWLIHEIARCTVRAMRPQADDNGWDHDWAMQGLREAVAEFDSRQEKAQS